MPTSLKVTVFDETDYAFARDLATRHGELPLYLQVGNPSYPEDGAGAAGDLGAELMARYRWLVGRVAADHWYRPTILPQLHVLAWGNEAGH